MKKFEVLKEVATFLQTEDANGTYLDNLEEDRNNIEEVLNYYKEILTEWNEEEELTIYKRLIQSIEEVL